MFGFRRRGLTARCDTLCQVVRWSGVGDTNSEKTTSVALCGATLKVHHHDLVFFCFAYMSVCVGSRHHFQFHTYTAHTNVANTLFRFFSSFSILTHNLERDSSRAHVLNAIWLSLFLCSIPSIRLIYFYFVLLLHALFVAFFALSFLSSVLAAHIQVIA